MAIKALALLAYALQLRGGLTGSVSSCGGASDHLSNVEVKVTPDPIQKGGSFTLEMSGMLDEDLTDGNVEANLDVKALKVIDKKVAKASPFSLSPGLKKGPQHIVIGPVSLPDLHGSVVVSGQVHLKNKAGEPVACVALDLNVPALLSDTPRTGHENALEELSQDPASLHGVASCGQSSDHFQGLQSWKSGGVQHITGKMDEDLTKLSVDVDLSLHVSFLHVPLKLTVPISYTPGIPKGPIAMSFGPGQASADGNALLWPKPKLTVDGTVKLNDDNSEEVACLAVNKDAALASSSVLV
mmetsp:Transcript_10751/g.20039  ORF Transcript_10751/g.20039 Transcript_10751/m.20039 type:complete len:298 (-) Transcript_10751:122-1015(-)